MPPAQRAVTLIVGANLAVYGAFRFLPTIFRGFLVSIAEVTVLLSDVLAIINSVAYPDILTL